ncbi:MAG: Membrane protein involved in the export of O-antigen and teichoic acid [uncultured Aureispira sp.]|uniref:Membrane protein involved in the export of O-antigen and teichoic acid n=1 Tax=uncultured Aureispira sp. TaxID=1331704 RepID=A0A6S6SHM0_9BACT|nr:MAG: Membrane protein involved in the export of O-antigen and teichoic acid [uncultured Aureispira sp.]
MAVQNLLNKLKKFSFFDTFKHISTYFSGIILVHMLGIVTLPVFTAYLTPDEYGIVNVFTTYITVVAVLLSLSLHSSIARYYFEEDKVDFKEFLGTIFITITALFAVQGGIILFFKEEIATLINLPTHLITWLIFTTYLIVVYSFYCQILVATKESKKYASLQVAWQYGKFGCTMLGLIYFTNVLYLEGNVATSYTFMGKIMGECFGTFILMLYVLTQLRKHISFGQLSFVHIKYALIYSIPLIPFALSNHILTSFDQWFINSTIGHAETGQYAFAYKIAMIYQGLVLALLNGARPSYYNYMNKKDYKGVSDQVDSMTKLLILGASFLILFAVDAGSLLSSSPLFLEALPIAPVIIGAYVFFGVSSFANRGIFFIKKNSYLAAIVLTSGLINILLNWYFIGVKGYTYQAAAYTTLASYIIMMLFSILVTKFILKLPSLPLGRILKYIVLLGIIVAINYTFGEPDIGLHLGWILFKGGLFILLGLLLFYDKLGLLYNALSKEPEDQILDQPQND